MIMAKEFDLVIIGTGPAGYTASIYAGRFKVSNLIIGHLPGGTISETSHVANFPTEEEIGGMALAEKMRGRALHFGATEVLDRVVAIKKIAGKKAYRISTELGDQYIGKTLILATGLERRKLGAAGEEKFNRRGVAYCATCDAPFFKNKTVAVVGGGDAANTASLHLAGFAEKVYQIYEGNELDGDQNWVDQLKKNEKITLIPKTKIREIGGDKWVSYVGLSQSYGGSEQLSVQGVFIEIGSKPNAEIFNEIDVKIDDGGYIIVDAAQSTNAHGIFAAGDITTNSNMFRQVITACAEGAVAAQSAFKYLRLQK